jgi:hypothetical protein
MNQDINTPPTTSATQVPPQVASVAPTKSRFGNLLSGLSKSPIYTNKKIFIPIVIFLIIMILITILGLLFGKKGAQKIPDPIPTKKPFILDTSKTSTPSAEALLKSHEKLNAIRDQINILDVGQKKLQPPPLDFNVRF